MNITWLGHSCFLIESRDGIKIITDPFNEEIGYKPYIGKVNIITISHHHFDHDYIKNIDYSDFIIDSLGEFDKHNIRITGYPSFHDRYSGAKRGKNIIYTYNIDNFKLCHLGDLGHELSEEYIDLLKNMDVLFIPVGGNYTIDGKTAAKIAKKLDSKIVIPMHYKTSSLSFTLDGVENFLLHMKNGERIKSTTLTLSEPLKENNAVKILDFKKLCI